MEKNTELGDYFVNPDIFIDQKYNWFNTRSADAFHDEMEIEKLKSIEEIAEMFHRDECLKFEQRNNLANLDKDGHIHPPKWVVMYYIEHIDDLNAPFLPQMERRMGTSLFANFNIKPFHGWNIVVLDPNPYWQLEGEDEVPIAIHYFRKAGIEFRIWPISEKHLDEPESTIVYRKLTC